jgi:hypothetical protein
MLPKSIKATLLELLDRYYDPLNTLVIEAEVLGGGSLAVSLSNGLRLHTRPDEEVDPMGDGLPKKYRFLSEEARIADNKDEMWMFRTLWFVPREIYTAGAYDNLGQPRTGDGFTY